MKVQGIRKRIFLLMTAAAMFFPLSARASEQDGVTLRQEESRVAVLVEMSNAQNEKITAVSVSLDIDPESKDRVRVEFEFAPELGGAEQGFVYNQDTGRMDIYAAAPDTLFAGEEPLRLGYIRVTPENTSELLDIEIGYYESSFKTVNASYGDKKPLAVKDTEPVYMQVGEGANYELSTGVLEGYLEQALGHSREEYTESDWERLQNAIQQARDLISNGAASQRQIDELASVLSQLMAQSRGPGAGTAGNGQGSSERDNLNQGLYDQGSGVVHDPKDARNISADIVRSAGRRANLVDMRRTGTAAGKQTARAAEAGQGGVSGQTGVASRFKASGKVSVVSPKDGPASILTSGDGDGIFSGIIAGDSEHEDESESSGEIRLDRENGGVWNESKGERKKIFLSAGILGAAAICAAAVILICVRRKKDSNAGKKKKSRKKKKRRHGKKTSRR